MSVAGLSYLVQHEFCFAETAHVQVGRDCKHGDAAGFFGLNHSHGQNVFDFLKESCVASTVSNLRVDRKLVRGYGYVARIALRPLSHFETERRHAGGDSAKSILWHPRHGTNR